MKKDLTNIKFIKNINVINDIPNFKFLKYSFIGTFERTININTLKNNIIKNNILFDNNTKKVNNNIHIIL